jgi:hypothetical protein
MLLVALCCFQMGMIDQQKVQIAVRNHALDWLASQQVYVTITPPVKCSIVPRGTKTIPPAREQ